MTKGPGQKDYSKKIITIPNILSCVRLLLIPLFVWLYIIGNSPTEAVIVLAVSALTDIIDGQIARRFNMISDVGKILDPAADKCTQGAILLCLTTHFHHMMLPFLLMVIKEPMMSVEGLLVIRHTGKVYGAEWHGKLNTTLMFIMYITHLLWPGIPPIASDCIICIVSCMMLTSLILYTRRNFKLIQSAKQQKRTQV